MPATESRCDMHLSDWCVDGCVIFNIKQSEMNVILIEISILNVKVRNNGYISWF
jgi:hypothetical protein